MKRELFIGLILIALLSLFIVGISFLHLFQTLSISPLIIAIFLGVVLAHVLKKDFTDYLHDALQVSTKQILRLGIILYGFRLTLQNIVEVGWTGVLFAVFIVFTTFVVGYIMGVKFFKMDKEIVILTAAGSSICGAAAVLATESVLKSSAYKSAVAVSTVVIFGTLAMILYPFLFQLNLLNNEMFGIYLGGTLHEVAHVVASGNAINSEVSNSAVIEKMIRVMMLAPFLIVLSFFYLKKEKRSSRQKVVIPWFAVIFVGVIIVNSFEIISATNIEYINIFDTFLLTMAMLSLGLQTHISKFKTVGAKPFYLAGILFLWLLFAGYLMMQFLMIV